MDTVALTVGICWTCTGLLLVALAVPLVLGNVKRNPFYGVRFRQSMASDEAWYAINRYGGKLMIAWSLPLIALGVAAFFLPLRSHPTLTLILGFAPLLFVFAPAVQSWLFARRYEA